MMMDRYCWANESIEMPYSVNDECDVSYFYCAAAVLSPGTKAVSATKSKTAE